MTITADETTAPTLRDFEITSAFQCYTCLECSLGYVGSDGSPCENCGGSVERSNFCFDCFSDNRNVIAETAAAWFATNPAPEDVYMIEGTGMGWRGRAGIKTITPDGDVTEAIAINSDWVQSWFIDPRDKGDFKASQSHHDSLGEVYMIRPATRAEVEEWRDNL